MTSEDKDNKDAFDEDSFYQDDYDEEVFDDEFEFEEDELDDDDGFDHTLEASSEDEPQRELEEEEWHSDDLDSQDESYNHPWPLGLFAAGIIALLLLAAGGYGVLEQRLETQKEVRQLRAKLATTTSNTEVAESRQAQRNLQIHNEELQSQIALLQTEISVLHKELSAQSSKALIQSPGTASPPPAPKIVTPASVQKAPPSIKATSTDSSIAENAWFVNFGSYKSETTANNWASRLSVNSGRIAVVPGEKKGTLYYRVRVLDLPSKEIAGKIALQLEQTHHLSRLWVGKQ